MTEYRNPYAELKAIGAKMDNHESDLYVRATAEAIKIVEDTGWSHSFFRSQIDGHTWIDIPFGFTPWWEARQKKSA